MIEWSAYEKRFRFQAARDARRRRFDSEYADRCLTYAKGLFDQELPIIYDHYHLSRLLGYAPEYLFGVSNAPEYYYRSYSIPKKSGGHRTITEPLPNLKAIQRWILENILDRVPVHRFAKGFVRKRSIRDNARYHQRQPLVLTVDIADFFGNVSATKVRRIFLGLGYTPRVAMLLEGLCTLNGALPQGAPTSPALSNLASRSIDKRLAGFSRKLGIRYTRYADDLTFSGLFDAGAVIAFVSRVVSENGFALNETKTRLMQRHRRQEVTGVVVNDKMQVPREVRRKVRQECYFIEKFGLEAHLHRLQNTRANYVRRVLGVVAFILFVNPEDADGKRALKLLVPMLPTEVGATEAGFLE